MFTREKIARLRERLGDAEWRRYGYLLLTGKALGVALLLTGVYYISSLVGVNVTAADAPPPVLKGNDIVNPLNTVWTFLGRLFGFWHAGRLHHAGGGLLPVARNRQRVMECIVDTCLCGLLFFAFGFAFMFSHGTPLNRHHWFFLQGRRRPTSRPA